MIVLENIIRRAISPASVRQVGRLTVPPSFGVYRVPGAAASTRSYRFGNHPIRMRELENEFGSCKLEYLFTSREDAKALALALEARS
jgi:hypothetical protein